MVTEELKFLTPRKTNMASLHYASARHMADRITLIMWSEEVKPSEQMSDW